MWSRKYECCQGCGTTDRKHYGGGSCTRCYNRAAYQHNPEPQKQRSLQYYQAHTDEKRSKQTAYYASNKTSILTKMRVYREEVHFAGLRQEALARDSFRCQKANCGATDDLTVHHVDGQGRGSVSPRNILENLTTLCRACHMREHAPRNRVQRKKI